MEMTILNYTFSELVMDGKYYYLYRARRQQDNQPMMIKILKRDCLAPYFLSKLKNEFEIMRRLDTPHLVKANAYELYHNRAFIVLEDFDGQPLKEVIKDRKLSLKDDLALAIELASMVEEMHRQQMMHGNLNSHNILINFDKKQVMLIECSEATMLLQLNTPKEQMKTFDDSIHYISPEQSGNMNRTIDYRTDIYSLGVILYELITKQVPFLGTNYKEILDKIVFFQPVSPSSLDNSIPQVLSEVILKCLAKNPEDRYQSVFGIKKDLQECLKQLNSLGFIELAWIAQHDSFERFHISQQIYGRENELQTIIKSLERCTQENSGLMLVAGIAGIGKTRLVNEIKKYSFQKKGVFVAGKCCQMKKNKPYGVWLDVFQNLLQSLEESGNFVINKNKLLQELGMHAQRLIEIIPDLQKSIGAQPQPPALEISNIQSRIYLLFSALLEAFEDLSQPLVFFLDDLQWVDPDSLKLMRFLLNNNRYPPVFFIGAYRDNEEMGLELIPQFIDDIRKEGFSVDILKLAPLSLPSINDLLCDSCCRSKAQISPLAEILYQRSQGIPFFAIQLLKRMHRNKGVYYNTQLRSWQEDMSVIQKMFFPDINDKRAWQNIKSFPVFVQRLIKIASSIGFEFDLSLLAQIYQKDESLTATHLWQLLQEDLIMIKRGYYPYEGAQVSGVHLNYEFSQDLIRSAIYDSTTQEERKNIHEGIGNTLLHATSSPQGNRGFFEVVYQLNAAGSRAETDERAIEIIQYNLKAGLHAKDMGAYFAAIHYFDEGTRRLGKNGWEKQYPLMFSLQSNKSICALINTDNQQTHKGFQAVIEKAASEIEKAMLCTERVAILSSIGKDEEALVYGVESLKLWGISLPYPPGKGSLLYENFKVKTQLFVYGLINNLNALVPDKDEKSQLLSKMWYLLWICASKVNNEMAILISLKGVSHALQQGVTPYSAPIFAAFASYLASQEQHEYKKGYQLGVQSLKIADLSKNSWPAAYAHMIFYRDVDYWNESFSNSISHLKEAEKQGFETGDTFLLSACLEASSFIHLIKGDNLENAHKEILEAAGQIKKYRDIATSAKITILQEVCEAIRGMIEDPINLYSTNLEPLLNAVPTYSTLSTTLYKQIWRIFLLYHHEQYEQALAISENIKPAAYQESTIYVFLDTYRALTFAAVCSMTGGKKKHKNAFQHYYEKIKLWSEVCPENFRHLYLLLSAEMAKLNGQEQEASDLYDDAIAAAENKTLCEEALIHELTAKFYLSASNKKLAAFYMQEAFCLYEKWGAIAKLQNMKKLYSELLNMNILSEQVLGEKIAQKEIDITQSDAFTTSELTTTTTKTRTTILATPSTTVEFDVASTIQASLEISGEIEWDKLLVKLMQVVFANAGADSAFLILSKNDKLYVEAEIFLGQELVTLPKSVPLEEKKDQLCVAAVRYVETTMKDLLLDDALYEGNFINDRYIKNTKTQSILCMPLIHQAKFIGILYLENRLTKGAFTPARVHMMTFLTSQIAISIENALDCLNLKQKVEERSQELRRVQNQLIQQEKMASLVLLTTGIAHEIKNPLNFVINFSDFSLELIQEMGAYLHSHEAELTNEDLEMINKTMTALKQNMENINNQGKLADRIVKRIAEHSHGEMGNCELTDIHQFLDHSLTTFQQELTKKDPSFAITYQKEYDPNVERAEIYPNEFNRVILNLLDNAYFAVAKKKKELGSDFHPTILIKTVSLDQKYEIRIKDNGIGIPSQERDKIFSPFFTTKFAWQGAGLGLSLSYDIVTEQHGGSITFNTQEGEFTEFIITMPIKIEMPSEISEKKN